MSTTVTLTANASAWINNSQPSTNVHNINTLKKSSVDLTYRSSLCLVFPGVDAQYQYKPYTLPVVSIYGKCDTSLGYNSWDANIHVCAAFDPDTVTWNTQPSRAGLSSKTTPTVNGAAWASTSVPDSGSLKGLHPSVDPIYLYAQFYPDNSFTMYGSASSYKPKIEITFEDDDANLEFKTLTPANGSVVVSGMAATFAWETQQSADTATEIAQASAVFQWKKPTDAGWTDVAVSGNVKECTIPAGTFPGGKILWRVVMTDVTGHTETSDTMTAYTTATISCSAAIYGSELGDENIPYDPDSTYTLRAGTGRMLIAKFGTIPAAIQYYKLVQTRFRAHFTANKQGVNLYGLATSADIQTVSYPGPERVIGGYGFGLLAENLDEETTIPTLYSVTTYPTGASQELKDSLASKKILTSDCVRVQAYSGAAWTITGPLAMEIAYDDSVTITSKVKQKNCPTSGWVNPAIAQTFAWEFITYDDWPCAGGFEQASGSFFWREQGQVAWNEVQASGSTQSVTIPANTFPGGTIEWYVEATDTNGTTTNTPTYTISTEDTIPTATPRDPVDVPVTGNKPIEFRWTVSNDSGTLPTQSELQTSTDGSTWTTLTTIVGSGLTYTAPAGTFTAGTVYWRVRATNRDGVAGSWSAAASFLSISAASPPVVTVDAVPFATINWQGAGQQAYRIRVDGVLYGPFFGTDKTFTLTEPLEDGEHTAEVEIQNSYSMWSDPGSATFTVANVPGDAVTLSGVFGVDAQLNWEMDSTADDYLVYRNGVRIGHTARKSFTDRLQIGEDDWFVINRIAGGYYTRSNTLLGTTSAETCWITAMDGTEPWTELKLTERSHTEQSYSYQRVHSLRHVSGATLPVLELSPYENRAATYDTAFLDAESARAFENLRGRVVILKARDEELVVGALASIKKTVGDFYRAYEFTVSRIHWEDYIDDQDD